AVLQGGVVFSGSGSAVNSTGTSNATLAGPGRDAGTATTAGTFVGFGSFPSLANGGTNLLNRLSDSANVRLQNGNQVLVGNPSATSTETIANLVLESGSFSTLTVMPGANRYANLGFTTLAVASGGTQTGASAGLLVRGPNLGAVPAGQTTAGVSLLNVSTTALSRLGLVGVGGPRGTTNISILPGVIGDTDPTGPGTTFVTIEDATGLATGLRPLAPSEFGTTVRPPAPGTSGLSSADG